MPIDSINFRTVNALVQITGDNDESFNKVDYQGRNLHLMGHSRISLHGSHTEHAVQRFMLCKYIKQFLKQLIILLFRFLLMVKWILNEFLPFRLRHPA